MSFRLEFTAASAADALAIIAEETSLPTQVSSFLTQALGKYTKPNAPATAIWVRAEGSIYNNDSDDSEARIMVRPVAMRAPKVAPPAPAPAPVPGPDGEGAGTDGDDPNDEPANDGTGQGATG